MTRAIASASIVHSPLGGNVDTAYALELHLRSRSLRCDCLPDYVDLRLAAMALYIVGK